VQRRVQTGVLKDVDDLLWVFASSSEFPSSEETFLFVQRVDWLTY
jgi:hypothetical protein